MKHQLTWNPMKTMQVTQDDQGFAEITLWDGWHEVSDGLWEGEIYHISRTPIPYRDGLADEIAENLPEWIARGKQEEKDERDEIMAANKQAILDQRKELLAASDYTQIPDYPMKDEDRARWRVYRQALRDITEQPGWPDKLDWPVPPTA